jgi:hypothetical protein
MGCPSLNLFSSTFVGHGPTAIFAFVEAQMKDCHKLRSSRRKDVRAAEESAAPGGSGRSPLLAECKQCRCRCARLSTAGGASLPLDPAKTGHEGIIVEVPPAFPQASALGARHSSTDTVCSRTPVGLETCSVVLARTCLGEEC